MATEDEIRTAMKQVEDPELGVNVVDLGLLYNVNTDDAGNVVLDMTLTSITAYETTDGSSLGDIDGGNENGPGFIPFQSTKRSTPFNCLLQGGLLL